jgi:hypothetical protein
MNHCGDCGDTNPANFYASLKTRCRQCQKAKMRAYYGTDDYRAANKDRQKARLVDPVERRKHNARNALYAAVVKGDVERPNRCQGCGILGPVHGHHEDYEKPLDVVWLCRPCHAKRHDGYRKKSA